MARSARTPRGKAAKAAKEKAALPPPVSQSPQGPGRPTDYTAELGARICDETATGSKLEAICAADEMPCRQTVYRWFSRHPDFAEAYGRARRARALLRVDEIDDIVQKVVDGDLDPNAARVAIDAHKWQAAKEDPRTFGEKVELTGKDGGPIETKDVTLLELAREVAYTLHRATAAVDLQPAPSGAALPAPVAKEA
jgi:hypothetical protein